MDFSTSKAWQLLAGGCLSPSCYFCCRRPFLSQSWFPPALNLTAERSRVTLYLWIQQQSLHCWASINTLIGLIFQLLIRMPLEQHISRYCLWHSKISRKNKITFVRLLSLQSIAESTQPHFSFSLTQTGTWDLRKSWMWNGSQPLNLLIIFLGRHSSFFIFEKMNGYFVSGTPPTAHADSTFEVQAKFSCEQLHKSKGLALGHQWRHQKYRNTLNPPKLLSWGLNPSVQINLRNNVREF